LFEDPDKELYFKLKDYLFTSDNLIYPDEIMETLTTLSGGFNSLSRSNSVTKIFWQIVGSTAKGELFNFSAHIDVFFRQNPDISPFVINELYALRNFHLIRQELLTIYHEDLIFPEPIEDRIPAEILRLLDIIPLFPGT
jgi:hypothetical protein